MHAGRGRQHRLAGIEPAVDAEIAEDQETVVAGSRNKIRRRQEDRNAGQHRRRHQIPGGGSPPQGGLHLRRGRGSVIGQDDARHGHMKGGKDLPPEGIQRLPEEGFCNLHQ